MVGHVTRRLVYWAVAVRESNSTMMTRKTIRRQPSVKGGRLGTWAGLHPEVRRRIDELAWKHNATRSWVQSTLLAHAVGFKGQEPYYHGK